ncbi:probable NADH dehydrogenase [ubiquinone] 1 alpha subcomplex subunit 5, mitochondrial [Dioscorea cayenensis subsp. rotundata]|uniref:Probable NADH dehydrogenase [ubiquinone] 1 alpha subcomplex subunit 5, mitochondrial n=1 Tax=Dioscorea cayennensis subsp. rotundata TaxID=55577 RepID=A0AB40BLC9_DIOCR|nr:probable NADH dehydrogenase [ubiquinone] 1 alpha subcomplex subunit 5, mitochondrial [Dioscorea cayenensis subsp. rotundata]
MFRRILTSAAAGVLRSKVKETTGFVGLDAVPTRREVLASLYTKTLKKIQAVETFTKLRLEVCQEEEDWEMIVEQYGCDQIDNLIERAQNELKFISKMMEWGSWVVPDYNEYKVIEDDTLKPKHVPDSGPGKCFKDLKESLELSEAQKPKLFTRRFENFADVRESFEDDELSEAQRPKHFFDAELYDTFDKEMFEYLRKDD